MRNSGLFYPKLALDNVKKNSKVYIPYLLTGIISATVYYILRSLSLNPGLRESFGGGSTHAMLQMGADVSAFFIILFLFYTNGFLMKQRQKEFAVFNILGMEKRHIIKTLAFEITYTFLISVSGGLVLGIALDKLNYLLIVKLMKLDITLGFFISPIPIIHVIVLFVVVNLLIFLKAVWSLHILNPAELLRESKAGEKEPKVKWFLSILGVLTLGIGYAIALHSENPLSAIPNFFIAAILVVIGTFLLFTTGSIAILKFLRKNKKFYYKTSHFVSVSGLIYRMKQNAMGLASICILSTMVLVMLSSTGSLMIGLEDMVNERYPYDYNFEIPEENSGRETELIKKIQSIQQEKNIAIKNETKYHHLTIPAVLEGYKFKADTEASNQTLLFFVPLSEYNKTTDSNEILNNHEILIHTKRLNWSSSIVDVLGEKFSVKKHVQQFPKNGDVTANILDTLYCVCTDEDFLLIDKIQEEMYGVNNFTIKCCYGFDADTDVKTQNELSSSIYKLMEKYPFSMENKSFERAGFMGLFGGMFFIGIILGLLFIMATVLIIYYKQLSEGYEDRDRFLILQKVGMSQKEVKKAIHSQILIVFFLPLFFAGMHLTVAFPILKKLLAALGLVKTHIFVSVTVSGFLIFALMYVFVYVLTAKTYYKIVRR